MNQEAVVLINKIKMLILNPIIGVMFAVAVVMFLYGIMEFIYGAENEDKREKGKQHMIWGIVGIFVMLAVYGIMNFLSDFWFTVDGYV